MPSVWDHTHASRAAQRVASMLLFFFLLFPSFFRLFLLLSYRPSHCSVLSLSISSLTALCRSSAFDSVPVSKLFVLSTISPFTTPFFPFTAFRSRISREELKGYGIEELKNQKIERCIISAVNLYSINISIAYLTHACIYHNLCCITVCE